jgi:uncharacterized protein YkwD
MPRTPRDAVLFLAGMWVVLTLLGPLSTPWAYAADPELARLEGQLHLSVNAFRREHRLLALERRADLDAVARAHCEDMIRRGYFSHDTPEGLNPVDRLHKGGVEGFRLAGENVGQTSQQPPNERILSGWENSPDHRANLMARPFNTTGIGIARAPDGRLFYTQLYATFPR